MNEANKLAHNTAKTDYMVFQRARIKRKTEKIIRNNEIAAVKTQLF